MVYTQTYSLNQLNSQMWLLLLQRKSAILEAVNHIDNNDTINNTIFTDSRSSIQIIRKITANHPILTEIQSVLVRLGSLGRSVHLCWVPSHVGVLGNEEADRLAGIAARSPVIVQNPKVPHKDYYPSIRKRIYENWQDEWTHTLMTNKLRSFRETIEEWPFSHQKVRKNEVMLTRLRIGHTRLTHRYLMLGCLLCTSPSPRDKRQSRMPSSA